MPPVKEAKYSMTLMSCCWQWPPGPTEQVNLPNWKTESSKNLTEDWILCTPSKMETKMCYIYTVTFCQVKRWTDEEERRWCTDRTLYFPIWQALFLMGQKQIWIIPVTLHLLGHRSGKEAMAFAACTLQRPHAYMLDCAASAASAYMTP